MIDQFELDHKRIVLSPETLTIRDVVAQECFLPLMTLEIPLSYWGILGTQNKRARSLDIAFQALIEEVLGYYDMHDEMYMHERRVAECIILHRVQLAIDEGPLKQHPDGSCWNPVLGTMIQQRLTLSLAELSSEDKDRLRDFTLGFLSPTSKEWARALVGASSATRVLVAAHTLDQATVYLPTVHEDRVYGIDLIVVDQNVDLAISVKTGLNGSRFEPILCLETPKRTQGQLLPSNEELIYNGAGSLSCYYGRSFYGMLVTTRETKTTDPERRATNDAQALRLSIQKAAEAAAS